MLMDSGAVKSAHPFQHPDWVVTPPPGGKVPAINTLDVLSACERVLAEKISINPP
jgi:hypothetical protein